MSKNKNNYNKMYDAAGKREDVKPVDEAVPTEVKEEVVEAVETVKMEPVAQSKPAKPKAKTANGTVKCDLLNVRVAPNPEATVAAVISKDSKVSINLSESTDGWYKVLTADKTTGYCMKKFIAV